MGRYGIAIVADYRSTAMGFLSHHAASRPCPNAVSETQLFCAGVALAIEEMRAIRLARSVEADDLNFLELIIAYVRIYVVDKEKPSR
jgi:hypothetical protein